MIYGKIVHHQDAPKEIPLGDTKNTKLHQEKHNSISSFLVLLGVLGVLVVRSFSFD